MVLGAILRFKTENPKYRIFLLGKIFLKRLDYIYILIQSKNFGLEADFMAEKDKFADEMLTDDELDQVSGGSNSEYEELQQLFGVVGTTKVDYKAFVDGTYDSVTKISRTKTVNCYRSVKWITNWLKNELNIDATINTYYRGWIPFYGGADNVYSRNGSSLMHAQVVGEIKAKLG